MIRTCLFAFLFVTTPALAHDTWVETHTNVIRSGDAIYVDLKLGNHGNDHRDFKLAGKPKLDASQLEIIAPAGSRYDLQGDLHDTGYAPNAGYWTAKFVPVTPGLYMVAHRLDHVVHYAPTRSIKSAKTFFVVSNSLDNVPIDNPGFAAVLGHPLELVPTANPVTPMSPGTPIEVQLLYKGKPMPATRVSFIPRGQVLEEGFDANHEAETDAEVRARFKPRTGNTYLVVAHHQEPQEAGENYQST